MRAFPLCTPEINSTILTLLEQVLKFSTWTFEQISSVFVYTIPSQLVKVTDLSMARSLAKRKARCVRSLAPANSRTHLHAANLRALVRALSRKLTNAALAASICPLNNSSAANDWSCENQQLALNSFHLYAVVEPLQSGPWRAHKSPFCAPQRGGKIARPIFERRQMSQSPTAASRVICPSRK